MSSAPRALQHPRDEIARTLDRIYQFRMTTSSGGNLSIRDEAGDVWITPAGVDKGSIRGEDVMRIDQAGKAHGLHRPSSELPFHQAIYRERPDLQAIVHAHPVALVAFSICRRLPNTSLFPQAAHVCGNVGLADYALPGNSQLGERIAAVFAKGFNCVLLENHGVVVGGVNLQEAFQRFETLEFTAKTIIKASLLGPIRYLAPEQIELARRRREPLAEFEPPAATTGEKAARREVCDFVRRGYRQRLMTSTEGSFSARLGDDAFVITPYGIDRQAIDIADPVLIQEGRREAHRRPSRAATMHRAIYRRHPNVRAIVNAIPVNATAFSVTAEALDTRTIPESYVVLRDVVRLAYGMQYEEPERIAELVSLNQPVALLENDGVLVLGKSVLDAFDRLEVLEATAEAVINARAIGDVLRMNDATIADLVRAFGLGGGAP